MSVIIRRHDDRGTVLVIWALLIVALLLMVAFAVDFGNLAQTRRQAQNAADVAALAAAREIGTGGTAGIPTAIDRAKEYVDQNYGIATTSPAWATCTDPDHLAIPPSTSAGQCVSFDSLTNPTIVRVRVPGKDVQFTFARAAGLTSRSVTAGANAAIVTPQGGYILPIAVAAGATGLQCIESGSGNEGNGKGGSNKVCSEPLASGDFGSLTSPRYRTFVSDDGTQDRDAVNFVVGIDHLILVAGSDEQVCDANSNTSGRGNKCSTWNDQLSRYDKANYVWIDQGNQLRDPTTGLVGPKSTFPSQWTSAGGTLFTARLKRPDGAAPSDPSPTPNPASPRIVGQFGSDPFNGVHISKYMTTPTGTTVRSSCFPTGSPWESQNVNAPSWDLGNECLDIYLRGSHVPITPIFGIDILKSPRFGFVPVVEPTGLNGNSQPAKVVDIMAVYLDRLYESGNSVKAIRAWVFDPAFIESKPVAPGKGSGFFGGPFTIKLVK